LPENRNPAINAGMESYWAWDGHCVRAKGLT